MMKFENFLPPNKPQNWLAIQPTFSFNVDGGRCVSCKGEGEVTIEMQFMADVKLKCETCEERFKREVLEVRYRKKHL